MISIIADLQLQGDLDVVQLLLLDVKEVKDARVAAGAQHARIKRIHHHLLWTMANEGPRNLHQSLLILVLQSSLPRAY
jgi:hypothetical protein